MPKKEPFCTSSSKKAQVRLPHKEKNLPSPIFLRRMEKVFFGRNKHQEATFRGLCKSAGTKNVGKCNLDIRRLVISVCIYIYILIIYIQKLVHMVLSLGSPLENRPVPVLGQWRHSVGISGSQAKVQNAKHAEAQAG